MKQTFPFRPSLPILLFVTRSSGVLSIYVVPVPGGVPPKSPDDDNARDRDKDDLRFGSLTGAEVGRESVFHNSGFPILSLDSNDSSLD